jgi:hypothetical protein
MKTFKIKIYKIEDDKGHFYIGSTKNTLNKRLYQHKNRSENKEKYDYKLYKNMDWKNTKIILLQEYDVNNKMEQLKYEDQHIKESLNDELCLNIQRAFRSDEEKIEYDKKWRDNNKEKIKELHNNWSKENPELIKKYNNEYNSRNRQKRNDYQIIYRIKNKDKMYESIKCECGGRYCINSHSHHKKTKKHIIYMENQQQPL